MLLDFLQRAFEVHTTVTIWAIDRNHWHESCLSRICRKIHQLFGKVRQ